MSLIIVHSIGWISTGGVNAPPKAGAKDGNGIGSDRTCYTVYRQIVIAVLSGSQGLLAYLWNRDAATVD